MIETFNPEIFIRISEEDKARLAKAEKERQKAVADLGGETVRESMEVEYACSDDALAPSTPKA